MIEVASTSATICKSTGSGLSLVSIETRSGWVWSPLASRS